MASKSKSNKDVEEVKGNKDFDELLKDVPDWTDEDLVRLIEENRRKEIERSEDEDEELDYILEKDESGEVKPVNIDEIEVNEEVKAEGAQEPHKDSEGEVEEDKGEWIDLSDIYEKPEEEDKPTEESKDDEVEEEQQQPSEELQQDQNYPVITEDGIIFADYDMVRVHEDDVLKMLRYRLWKIDGFNTLWQDMEVQFINPLSAIRFARLCRNNGRRVAVVKWRNVYKVFIEVSNPIAYIEFQSYI